MHITRYPNPITKTVESGTGHVTVEWPLLGEVARFDDGSVVPRKWLYIDATGPEGSPVVIVECEIGDDLVPRVIVVMLAAADGGREVQASDLRRVRPLEDILEQSFDLVAVRESVVVDEPVQIEPRDLAADADARRRALRGVRRDSRRRFTDEIAEEVARVYVANIDSGAPTRAVGERFSIKPSTASLYVKRARSRIDKLIEERRHGSR